MNSFYDILFTVNNSYELIKVEYGNDYAKKLYSLLFNNWVTQRSHITSVFPLDKNVSEGSFIWDSDLFYFRQISAPQNNFYYMLIREDYEKELFVQTLNQLTDAVQIYDKNGSAVFFNQTSRKIYQIPDDIDIRNRHLLDLFDIEEDISTTLTALRTQAPVINRVDSFHTADGIAVSSANTAYPLKKGNTLIGAATFERTREIVAAFKEKNDLTEKALNSFRQDLHSSRFSGYNFEHIVGHGANLQRAISIAKRIAPNDSSVLLVGETGTGKEIFAQSIHRNSSRKNKKFVALNCAAIPESLIESLLFGTQKGSFTGSENKPGFFEEAEGGTLFLDELNSMSLAMQSKILRAIQENSFRRVGGQKDIRMNIRILSSCNKDPFLCIEQNQLRKDLFYRLSTVMIDIPPLREHMEDLQELIEYHLSATAYQYVHGKAAVSEAAFSIMSDYEWPGNVRELFHVLDYAQNLVDGAEILPQHLPEYLTRQKKEVSLASSDAPDTSFDFHNTSLQALIDAYEHKILQQALQYYGGNITQTAEALGIRRQSLQYRIRKYGIII